jgi:hypothetical protein
MRLTIITLVFFLVASSTSATSQQSVITGTISDSEGAAIKNARVLIHWDPSGSTVGLTDNIGTKQDVIVVTDERGQYSATVPPGFYDLFVTAMAFTPVATKVRVKEGQHASFNAKLRADRLVTKELGTPIYAAPR